MYGLLFVALGGRAQTRISGTIISPQQRPVRNVTIQLKQGKDIVRSISDSAGNFSVIAGKNGKWLLLFTAVGYRPYFRDLDVDQTVDLQLGQILIDDANEDLQTVEVVGTKGSKYYNDYSFSATKIAAVNKDIPQSISTVSKELMADRQAANVVDAVKNVAGVSQSSFYNQFAIRGINQNQEGTIINGMRTNQAFFNQPLTNNLERVEVLKGPASATFSSVDPGGSVNLVTKKPLANERREVSITSGSFSTIRAAMDFTGPLNQEKTLLYRLNIGYEDSKSFRDLQYKKAYLISPSITYLPDDKTSLNVELVLNNSKSRLDRGQPIFGAIAGQTDLNTTPISFNMGSSNDYFSSQDIMMMANFSRAITSNISLNVAYMKQGWNEDLLEHRTNNAFAVDETGTPVSTLAGMQVLQRQQKWGSENLSAYFSISAKTGGLVHKLVVGYDRLLARKFRGGGQNTASGYRLKDGTVTPRFDPAKKDLYVLRVVNGLTLPVPNVDHFDLATPSYPLRNHNDYVYTRTEIPPAYSLVNGIYVQDQISYGPAILTLGLRQEWYDDYSSYELSNEKLISRKKLLPRVGLTYALNSNINVYGTYLTGYQPQGNTTNLVITPPPAGTNYKPLESDLKEIGLKSEWMNRMLMVNLAVFEINQRNLLLNANDPVDVNLLVERGAQRSRGFEAEVSGFILPQWQFTMAYSYVDAIVNEDSDPTMVGERVQNTPKHSGSIWTRYNIRGIKKLEGLGFGAGVQYSGNKLPLYIRNFVLPAYTIADAAIYYSPSKSRVQLAMNMNNIFDKTYWVGAQNYFRLFPGAPRNVMFNVTYKF